MGSVVARDVPALRPKIAPLPTMSQTAIFQWGCLMSSELEAYLASIKDLRAAYDGLTKDQLHAHPVDGKWSAMEVLCHLVDIELMIAMRIRAALQRDTPKLQA